MKAIVREKYGSTEVIEIKDVKKPEPKKNEVLIRVYAATVNRTDCGVLTGLPHVFRLFIGLFRPRLKILGTDFAGIVEGVGENVQNFKIGDKVWGLNDEGLSSYAEYMTIREDRGIVHMPEGISFKEVVACAEGAFYANNFLNKINLEKGNKVIVNGATGAIGSAALQILKSRGMYVCAVANTKNLDLVKSLGADKIYNYEEVDFTEVEKEKYHLILDAVGKSTFGKCKSLLLPKGIYSSSELGPGAENIYLPLITKIKGGKRVVFPIPSNVRENLLEIKELIEKKQFRAVIDRIYQPEQVKEAFEFVMTGEKTGNVILDFKSES